MKIKTNERYSALLLFRAWREILGVKQAYFAACYRHGYDCPRSFLSEKTKRFLKRS